MYSQNNNAEISIIIITAILLLLTTFIVSMFYYYQKKQFHYFSEIEKLKSEHENTILSTQLEIQENTIQAISRDIHDNINLTLTLAKLTLNTINTEEKTTLKGNISNAIDLIGTAINDLANISRSMNADLISEQGLIHVLAQESDKIKKLDRFDIETKIIGEPIFLSSQKELFIFRIIQESLNNILKHSNATSIRLELKYNQTDLHILISDNGIGISNSGSEQKKNRRSGILNMQKRASLIGGSCSISGSPGEGSVVSLKVPY